MTEDTRQLQVSARNVLFLRTSDTTDMTRLLRATLRLRPNRIVVGEVRYASALTLLKAWNTGHPGGVGTVHAQDVGGALIRIGQLIQEAAVPLNPEFTAAAVNVIVSVRRADSGRSVEEVATVRGWSAGSGLPGSHRDYLHHAAGALTPCDIKAVSLKRAHDDIGTQPQLRVVTDTHRPSLPLPLMHYVMHENAIPLLL